jgi:rod shape-determining protein MreC
MFRFFSKIWNEFKEYIILVLLLILSLVTLSLNEKPGIKKVHSLAFGAFASVTSVISNVINTAKVESENERLRKVNAELMLQVNKLREYAVVNEQLKKLLEIKDSLSYPLIPAKVVSKSLTKSQSTITINIGSKNGVKPGMPVINDLGLVGIVNSTSDDYSIARTLKNIDLKVTVKDERSRVDGVMKWNGEDLVIINVPKTYDIEPGDRIISSELSSIVPVPIQVGVVLGLTKVGEGIFNEVKIKSYVDFVSVENVFVIGIVESKEKKNLELNFYKREEK